MGWAAKMGAVVVVPGGSLGPPARRLSRRVPLPDLVLRKVTSERLDHLLGLVFAVSGQRDQPYPILGPDMPLLS